MSSIAHVQHATIELFKCLCTYGYGVTHASIAANDELSYRGVGDVVYVVDKMAKVWPTYIPCVIVGRVNHQPHDTHETHDNEAAAAAHGDMIRYVVRHFTVEDEEGEGEEGEEEEEGRHSRKNSKHKMSMRGTGANRKKSGTRGKSRRKKSRKQSKLGRVRNREMKSDYPDGTYDTSSSDSDDEREHTYTDSDDDSDDGTGEVRRDSAMFDGRTTILVEEVNILSGRQFALEIGFHFSVITIIQEQVSICMLPCLSICFTNAFVVCKMPTD